MFGEILPLLVAALPYVVPILVVAVGIRYWWEWRRSH
jgi:hypothetical protein